MEKFLLMKVKAKDLDQSFERVENEQTLKLFRSPDLISHILKELDAVHKLDIKEKLAGFLVAVTAELPDPEDHCSTALKGDSSSGKDNLIRSVFRLFPQKDNFFLTRATSSALEDEAEKVKRIAFSEINKNREGANSEITETFKQLAEGGVDVLKKDVATGFKTTKRFRSRQKSLFYGTTETEADDELETRYVVIPVRGGVKKNQVVVDDVLDKSCNIDFYLGKGETSNWVANGIGKLDTTIQPIIPFSFIFKERIKDEDGEEKFLFDYRKERIKRDSKRLLSLTKGIAWLHQLQRVQFTYGEKQFLYAEPSDFLLALEVFADFFNLTYTGLDHRLLAILDEIKLCVGKHSAKINELGCPIELADWVLRTELQKSLGIQSRTTIGKYIRKLRDLGLVETDYNPTNPKAYLIYPSNQPSNDRSLPVSWTALHGRLDRWLNGENGLSLYNKFGKTEIEPILVDFTVPYEKNERSKLSGQFSENILTDITELSDEISTQEEVCET